MMYAVAVGPLSAADIEAFRGAAGDLDFELTALTSAADAKRHLKHAGELPKGIFLSRHVDIGGFVAWMRDDNDLFNIPVVALVSHPSDSEFRGAFSAGADDVILEGDCVAFARRLQNLAALDSAARPPTRHGLALVAAPNLSQRRQIGRTLRQAGFEVAFAAEARELVAISRSSSPALVVATPSFPPLGGEAAVRSVRTATRKPDLPALVMGEHGQASYDVAGHIGDARGQLLFLADELVTGRGAAEQRRSKRTLYSTICAFRPSGLMEPTYGLSYNLSREGLYVQTLDPPTPGTLVWLELRTRDNTPVHLRGTAMWRRRASEYGSAPPPGFGVRLDAAHCPPLDLANYALAYDQLLVDYQAIN